VEKERFIVGGKTSPLPLRELSQSNIDTIDLGKFTPHKTKIKDVIHLIHKSRHADYSARREALVEFCTSSLENGFNSKLRGGVIMQIANPAIRNLSNSISSTVVEGITNLFDDTQGQKYSASGDSDESIVGKIQLAVHRLFTKKQNPVEEEVVEEEVVAEEVEIKESAFENVPQRKKNVINISRKTTNRSRGRVKANNNLISLTSESGRLALDLPSYREVSLNLNPLAIFRVSTNQGSDSALGKTADLIIMQTSKLYNYI
jgi:hypothetical protein